LHDCKSAVSASPKRKAHYRWRELFAGVKVFIIMALLEVVLPEEESDDGQQTKNKESDDVYGGMGARSTECDGSNDVQGVTHP
jgi:hypothetical protein